MQRFLCMEINQISQSNSSLYGGGIHPTPRTSLPRSLGVRIVSAANFRFFASPNLNRPLESGDRRLPVSRPQKSSGQISMVVLALRYFNVLCAKKNSRYPFTRPYLKCTRASALGGHKQPRETGDAASSRGIFLRSTFEVLPDLLPIKVREKIFNVVFLSRRLVIRNI